MTTQEFHEEIVITVNPERPDFTPSQTRFRLDKGTDGNLCMASELVRLLNMLSGCSSAEHNKKLGFTWDMEVQGVKLWYPATEVVMTYLRGMDSHARQEQENLISQCQSLQHFIDEIRVGVAENCGMEVITRAVRDWEKTNNVLAFIDTRNQGIPR